MRSPGQKHATQKRVDTVSEDVFRCVRIHVFQHACTIDEVIVGLAYVLASMCRNRPDAMVDVRRAFAAMQVPDIRRRA